MTSHQGALTPETAPEDTVDGLSMKRIDAIIDKLDRRYANMSQSQTLKSRLTLGMSFP